MTGWERLGCDNGSLIIVAVMHDLERGQSGPGREQTVSPLPLQVDPAVLADEVEAEIADLRDPG